MSQCVSWTTTLCRETRSVGGFVWHQEHLHYHYEDFASYELRRLNTAGEADMSAAGLITASPKVSFCLVDSTQVRSDAVPVPRYNSCQPLEEGISPGWSDVYHSDLEGQSLSLDGLTDGSYALLIAMDTSNRLYETDDTNNRVIATVAIRYLGQPFPEAEIIAKHTGA